MSNDVDDGRPDPAVVQALTAVAGGAPRAEAVCALSRSRVLVPVVATVEEPQASAGQPSLDKRAALAAVLMTGQDGRQALLAFTGLDRLTAWNPAARPVPMPISQAARAALAEGAAALVVDVAGPVLVALEASDVAELATGHVLVRTPDGYAWARRPER